MIKSLNTIKVNADEDEASSSKFHKTLIVSKIKKVKSTRNNVKKD